MRRAAWPAIAVAAASLSAVSLSVLALATEQIPWPLAVLVSSVACFAGFTPVHEAAHHNICRSRALGDLVGSLCALLLLGALGPYRYLHREHHRHTNDPERDPDYFRPDSPPWLLLLRFVTQDITYLRFYARRSRPVSERLELAAAAALCAFALLGAAYLGREAVFAVVVGWIVPARVALAALAATFAWLPHAPHTATAAEDPYRATSVRSSRALEVLLLGQSYHLVHHLQPGVPFYALGAVWRARKAELVALGAVDRSERQPEGEGGSVPPNAASAEAT